MRKYCVSLLLVFAVAATVFAVVEGIRRFKGSLTGYEEVPAVSTGASGDFKATINDDETAVSYELSYTDLEGTVTQAHIHFGQAGANGAIQVWLCGTASNPGPAGTQTCPPPPATITGTITSAEVTGQPAGPPAGQGIQPGEFGELLKAIRAGKTYANVHSNKFPGGEVRSQLGPGHSNGQH